MQLKINPSSAFITRKRNQKANCLGINQGNFLNYLKALELIWIIYLLPKKAPYNPICICFRKKVKFFSYIIHSQKKKILNLLTIFQKIFTGVFARMPIYILKINYLILKFSLMKMQPAA